MKKMKMPILYGTIVVIFAALLVWMYPKNTSHTASSSLPKIIVGCDDYRPFNYRDLDGHVRGIDVELAEEAFRRMGYTPEFHFINWEEKKSLLADHKIDCIWSSFTMTGRESQYQWAGPYMKSHQVIAVNPESPITKLSDLEGKSIALQSTTKPEDIFRRHDPSMPHFNRIISAQNKDVMYTLLSKGYVDAIAAHDTSIHQFTEDFQVSYRILDVPLQTVGLGVAFDKNETRDLPEKLNEVLEDMKNDGTTEKIIKKYVPKGHEYVEE